MLMPGHEEHYRKHTKSVWRVFAGIMVVLVAVVAMWASPRIVERVPNLAAVISSVLIELTNNDRSTSGLATLTMSPALTAVAQAKADDMAAKGYFAHTSPEGKSPWYWFHQEGYLFAYAGENLAVDFGESADVERAWMNSPTHRANVLGTQFTEIGIAVATGTYQGRPTTFVVQEFGTPASRVAITEAAPAATTTRPSTSSGSAVLAAPSTTTPALATRPVREISASQAPTLPALATTLPTTTPVTPTIVLGESAGAYLAKSADVPWWFKLIHYFF